MTPPSVNSITKLIDYGTTKCRTISDSAKLDAQLLLCHVIDKERAYLLTWPEKELTESEAQSYFDLVTRRMNGEPIAYILKQREFWSLPLEVHPSTLIPRPDTEVLIEAVLARYTQSGLQCLDLGTGTGAIALALASEHSNWQIDAVDFNLEAVALATRNLAQLAFNNVVIFQSDWFANVPSDKKYDIIVSNPPYIDENDPHLTVGDVRFEPTSALVAGNKGLADIELISQASYHRLNTNGALFIEHGFEQSDAVQHIFAATGYRNIETINDYNGQPRVTLGFLLA